MKDYLEFCEEYWMNVAVFMVVLVSCLQFIIMGNFEIGGFFIALFGSYILFQLAIYALIGVVILLVKFISFLFNIFK